MPIDDQQLDELLRDLRVPNGLHDSLLGIPDQELDQKPNSVIGKRRSSSGLVIVGILTAIAATVLLFASLSWTPVAPVDNSRITGDVADASRKSAELLAKMKQDLKAIEEICSAQDAELARLEAMRREPEIDLNESIASTMSVSWQSALDQGAKIESVRSELEYVVNSFPNTAGARQAHDILRTN